jgi:hypothetical protein
VTNSEDKIKVAQKKAIDLLKVSIASLKMSLGVSDDEDLTCLEIPVSEDDDLYKPYLSLVRMFKNLTEIESRYE